MDAGFIRQLVRFGPDRRYPAPSLGEARAFCTRLARTHYENFTVASLMLPRRLLRHFHAVYAYCRWADDLADETGSPEKARALLAWWRRELLDCYEGEARHPVMVALRDTIHRFSIPPEPFLDLLVAFEQDQNITRYETFEKLLGYCSHSANPVGRLVLYLCESFDAARAFLSDQVCTALQLTNFWQDVSRDFDLGRVYLPAEDRKAFGYSEADLNGRRHTPAFARLLEFEVERTRDFFHRGYPLVEQLPHAVQGDVRLFIEGGLAVLRRIAHARYNVWEFRPVLPPWQRAALLARAVAGRFYASWLA